MSDINPKNNKDYEYWEGSFKGYSPKELLALSDEELQGLFNEFVDKGLYLKELYTYYKDYKKSTLNNENNNDPVINDIEKEIKQEFGDTPWSFGDGTDEEPSDSSSSAGGI